MNKHSKLMWNTLLILVQKTLTSFQNKLICFHSLTPLKMRFFRKVPRLAISKMYQYSSMISTILKKIPTLFSDSLYSSYY